MRVVSWRPFRLALRQPVFLNFFAAAGPSANVFVAHGTRYSDPSLHLGYCETVELLQPHRTAVANSVPGNFGLFRRKPWQPLVEP